MSALEGQGPADMVGVKVLFLQQHPPPCCPTLSRDAWREALAGGWGEITEGEPVPVPVVS